MLFSLCSCSVASDFKKNETQQKSTSSSNVYTEPLKYENYTYISEDDGIVLLSYNGNEKDVTVPTNINNVDIKEIGNDCFSKNKTIESVTIRGNIKKIGNFAFYDCPNLKFVTLKNKLEEIGISAFYSCSSLEKISFPSTLKLINQTAFTDCTSLTTISFSGKRDLSIKAGAFSNTALVNVVLPEGTQEIENAAFCGCKNLKAIIVPNSVSSIGKSAFKKTPNVTIWAKEGSYAIDFAKATNEKYKIT